MFQPSTVMGPGTTPSKPLAPTDPPMFNPEGDLQEYRRDVTRWVETIQAAAENGTDRMYKTVYATLARHLYHRELPREQKSIVDEAHAKKIIDYKQNDQIKGVRQIVQLIAIETPIAVVSRLIFSFTQVTQCKRRLNEDLSVFFLRFRGLASDHLMYVGLSKFAQVSEVLAITLLNNSMFSEETLTNAKLQLISLAEARQRSEGEPELSMSKSSHESLLTFIREITEPYGNDEALPQPSKNANTVRRKATDLVNGARQLIHRNSELFNYITEISNQQSITRDMFSASERCKLNLNDAVKVIKNLTFTPKKSEKAYTKADIENMVGQRVQQALAAFQKQNEPNRSSRSAKMPRNSGSNNSRLPSNRGFSGKRNRPEPEFCYDCGDPGHCRGDTKCKRPSFLTKKIRSEAELRSNPTDTKMDRSNRAFRKGSNPSQCSHL